MNYSTKRVEKACNQCGVKFMGLPVSKFCSKKCSALHYRNLSPASDFKGGDLTIKGIANELFVCYYLMRHGLSCYRPCSPADKNDIIVIQDGVITIQVRTMRIKARNSLGARIPPQERHLFDVWAFVADPGAAITWKAQTDTGERFLMRNGINNEGEGTP